MTWAAGLFDGEGSITKHYQQDRGRPYWRLTLGMTDEDLVRRFHEAVRGLGTINLRHPPSKQRRGEKPMWVWASGSRAHVYAILAMLYPFFGERRRARAREALAELPLVNRRLAA